MSDESRGLAPFHGTEMSPAFLRIIGDVREELRDNPYFREALRVIPVGGYRSAIGCFWNAVIDDLRNKVLFRSVSLFNKEMKPKREIKRYEDFQDIVNDDDLIDGAFKIGVISWEAHKVLKHAKETRHIFDGHPKSSDPSLIKVLSMMEDCVKYVLSIESPPQIIDIDDYISTMNDPTFDRNKVAIENALGDLPETYKNELANRLFTAYIVKDSSTTLKGNIEFILPVLWNVLPKDIKVQVVRRVDQAISKADILEIESAFNFVRISSGDRYLTTFARKYRILPLIEELEANMDNWSIENRCIEALEAYAPFVPFDLLDRYVACIVQTYVGTTGASNQFSRTDFFANGASLKIPSMFELFDDNAADAFTRSVIESDVLGHRLRNPAKMRRLRTLAEIVKERATETFRGKVVLDLILDEQKEKELFRLMHEGK